MKRKIISIVLTITMALSCLTLFSGCFGGPPEILNESSWQELFDEVNFHLINDKASGSLKVTPNSYNVHYTEYGKNLTYKGNTYDYYTINQGVVESIDASSYVDYSAMFAPFFTFMHDNFNNFTMTNFVDDSDTQVFVFNGEIPEDAKTAILQMLKATFNNKEDADAFTYNFHSIFVVSNYDNFRGVFFADGDCEYSHSNLYGDEHLVAFMNSVGDLRDHEGIKALEEKEQMLETYAKLETMFKPVNDFEGGLVNFKVTGGTGADYMEFYFNKDGMRFYTPNAVNTPGIDGIYYNDNGVYKYYKMTKEGVWSVETITKDRFENTIKQMYELYCGGKWLNEDSLENYLDLKHSKTEWKLGIEPTASASGLSFKYCNIKLKTDGNFGLLGGSWELEMSNLSAKITYSYTLTVGEGAFTVPSL